MVRGAKTHITGVSGGHEMMVFPTQNMKEDAKDYAVVFSCPVNTPGITYIFGRQTNDGRKMDTEHPIDQGNFKYACVGGECVVVFNDVFIPWEDVYMYKEYDFAGMFVEAFATAHRSNYGSCKGGICDVLLGATYGICKVNGVERVGHVKDKMADMINLIETLYAGSLACSYEGHPTPSGAWRADTMLGNITKHNTTKFIYEIDRIAQDSGGRACWPPCPPRPTCAIRRSAPCSSVSSQATRPCPLRTSSACTAWWKPSPAAPPWWSPCMAPALPVPEDHDAAGCQAGRQAEAGPEAGGLLRRL